MRVRACVRVWVCVRVRVCVCGYVCVCACVCLLRLSSLCVAIPLLKCSVVVMGGWDGCSTLDSVEAFDGAAWAACESLPLPRECATVH